MVRGSRRSAGAGCRWQRGFGKGRDDRKRATKDILDTVDRWASMGRAPFTDIEGERTWQLCLAIPSTAFFAHDLQSFEGLNVRGNVYKCGDMLPHPHFLSLFPIDIPKPDFHRPDFFGNVMFE